MDTIQSARKAAATKNTDQTDTADLVRLREDIAILRTLEKLPAMIADMRGQMVLMQATQEATQGRVISIEITQEATQDRVVLMQAAQKTMQEQVTQIDKWVTFTGKWTHVIGQWVEFTKKEGLHVPYLMETMQYLRVTSRTLQTANVGPNAALMQEMIAPTVAVAKRIGRETRAALRVSGWNGYRIAVTTAIVFVVLQTVALIIARATGTL